MSDKSTKMRSVIMTPWEISRMLEGAKVQFRRYVAPQPPDDYQIKNEALEAQQHHAIWLACPLGEAGDRIWIKEDFTLEDLVHCDGEWSCKARYADNSLSGRLLIPAAEFPNLRFQIPQTAAQMPVWAARLHLRILSTKLHRLLEITEADARKEGMYRTGTTALNMVGLGPHAVTPRENYLAWWDTHYGHYSLADQNPWVWAVTVERVL